MVKVIFFVHIKSSSTHKIGYSVSLKFKLSQHNRDKQLMQYIINYLNCGIINKNNNSIDLVINKYDDIINKLIPFFDSYKILGVKYQDFLDFKKVSELMSKKDHLTIDGFKKIKEIKKFMNKGRIS